MQLSKISKKDYKYVPKDPEKGFDAMRNAQIINEVIEDTDKMVVQRQREFEGHLKERTEAVANFLKNIERGGEDNINKYFGKKEIARLRGEEILRRIQQGLSIIKDGKVIKRAGD